jgi:hypothetical protein
MPVMPHDYREEFTKIRITHEFIWWPTYLYSTNSTYIINKRQFKWLCWAFVRTDVYEWCYRGDSKVTIGQERHQRLFTDSEEYLKYYDISKGYAEILSY